MPVMTTHSGLTGQIFSVNENKDRQLVDLSDNVDISPERLVELYRLLYV